eukprot:5732011-Pyramimonas_sp.AAC.1
MHPATLPESRAVDRTMRLETSPDGHRGSGIRHLIFCVSQASRNARRPARAQGWAHIALAIPSQLPLGGLLRPTAQPRLLNLQGGGAPQSQHASKREDRVVYGDKGPVQGATDNAHRSENYQRGQDREGRYLLQANNQCQCQTGRRRYTVNQ